MLCSKTCVSLEDCLKNNRCSSPPSAHTSPLRGEVMRGGGIAKETDPSGKSPHEAGAKLDAGKRRDGLVLLGFSRALAAVSAVGTHGANKYTDNGWMSVPNGQARYTDAMLRHLLSEASGELTDKDTGRLHAAHVAWNALARLDLMIRGGEELENIQKN